LHCKEIKNSPSHIQCKKGFKGLTTAHWLKPNGTYSIRGLKNHNCTVLFFFFYCGPTWAMTSSFMRFLDHTQQCTTRGRTLLDTWSACCRDFWQHTTLTRDRHPCPQWDMNPQSQQASTHRPMPYTTLPLGSALHCDTSSIYSLYVYIHRYMKRSFRAFQICHYLMWIIWTATDNPLSHPITPSCTRESPIAAKPTRCTTWNQILCWKVEVLCAIWTYANPVRHGFHSTKCLEDIYIYIYTHRDLNTKTLTEHITCLFI